LRLIASLTSFSCQQQRSEILICFLRRRQVFLKISFLILSRLGFLCSASSIRFRVLLSAAKRRDFDLLSQRRQVLFKKYFEALDEPSTRHQSKNRSSTLAFSNLPPLAVVPDKRCVVISEAHDYSTGLPSREGFLRKRPAEQFRRRALVT